MNFEIEISKYYLKSKWVFYWNVDLCCIFFLRGFCDAIVFCYFRVVVKRVKVVLVRSLGVLRLGEELGFL